MKTFLVLLVTLFCQPGTLTSYEYQTRFHLKCPENSPDGCYFDLDLPPGSYKYVSDSVRDTLIFLVTKQDGTFVVKSTGDALVIK